MSNAKTAAVLREHGLHELYALLPASVADEVWKLAAALAEAREDVTRLRSALGFVTILCDNLHHAKRDLHTGAEPCPVEARIRAALDHASAGDK